MKHILTIATVLTSLLATQAFAADHRVPQATLNALGLAGMEVVSDEAGMQVRGKSGNAMSMGQSLVFGLLIDPNTKSYVFGTDANGAMASAENAGLQVLTSATHSTNSSVDLNLNTTLSGVGSFTGFLMGAAGGNGFASSQ